MNVDQVLAQIRSMRSEISGGVQAPAQDDSQVSFGAVLKNSLDAVNTDQQQASALKKSFELGDEGVDLTQVMIATQKSSIEFQAVVQVRNKVVEAYKDIMNMSI